MSKLQKSYFKNSKMNLGPGPVGLIVNAWLSDER